MASSSMKRKQPLDEESAIKELMTIGHESMIQLLSLLQQSAIWVDEGSEKLSSSLSQRVLEALEVGLSFQTSSNSTLKAKPHVDPVAPRPNKKAKLSAAGDQNSKVQRKSGKSQELDSWTLDTPSPYYDPYQWRQYGDKPIRGAKYRRIYYRCANEGCPAKKKVQRKDGDDSLYQVEYIEKHSCNTIAAPHPLPMVDPHLVSFARFTNTIQQGQQHLLSPIIAPLNNFHGEMFRSQNDKCSPSINPTFSDVTTLESTGRIPMPDNCGSVTSTGRPSLENELDWLNALPDVLISEPPDLDFIYS